MSEEFPVIKMLEMYSTSSKHIAEILVKYVDYYTMGDYAVLAFETLSDEPDEYNEMVREMLRDGIKRSDKVSNPFKKMKFRDFPNYSDILEFKDDGKTLVMKISI